MAGQSTAQALPDIHNVHPTSSAWVKNGISLETLSSCNIACEAMVESLNQAALEAYILARFKSIELLLFQSKDCIGNNLRRCKFPSGTLHALIFFKSTYIIQALTSNYYGSVV